MIPTETDLIQVTCQMFITHEMEDPKLSSFQKGTERFRSIGMNITTRILFSEVVDR